MRFNPSLTARLRIGFLILFVLLLVVSLLGIGHLFRIRVGFEDDISRYFQLELQAERLDSSFVLEQAAIRPGPDGEPPDARDLGVAADMFAASADRAAELAGSDPGLVRPLRRLVAGEARWREQVAEPRLLGEPPRRERSGG